MFEIRYTVKRIDGDYAILTTDGSDETQLHWLCFHRMWMRE